ncbi:MAG: hypothetical protein V4650_09930 [Pseudomonadota bacterium]
MSQGPSDIRNSFLEGLENAPQAPQDLNLADALAARLRRGPVSPALSKALQLGAARADEPACVSFVAEVLYRSGLEWSTVDPAAVGYQLMRPDRSLLGRLGYESPVEDSDGRSVRELVEPVLQFDIRLLASAVWATSSFSELKSFMRNLGAVLRYSSDLQGRVLGLVVPGQTLAALIAELEAKGYQQNVENRAHDDLPDLLGLRRKVMQLDQERHESQQPVYGRFDPRRLLGLLRR